MRRGHAAIACVFAKAPRPGRVKTRLSGAVGPDGAASLAAAFLHDTLTALRCVPALHLVLATEGEAALLRGCESLCDDLWPQPQGDLGHRLEVVLSRALQRAPCALALGGDTPGLPAHLIGGALAQLEGGGERDAVLGPSEDGGFYLLGLRAFPRGMLEEVPWSSDRTLQRTRAALDDAGLRASLLPSWFDVDTPSDLRRLLQLALRGEVHAPRTLAAARELGVEPPTDASPQ